MTTPRVLRYDIRSELGAGSLGVVYSAGDRLRQQMVALKVIRSQNDISLEEKRLSLAREFAVMASLRHPYIVSVHDYGFTSEQQAYYTWMT